MPTLEIIRHRAAICGYVSDASSGAGIANATVEIVGQDLQAQSGLDGFYYFLDLANGAYTLRAAAPAQGTRYGSVTVTDVAVSADSAGRPVLDAKGNLSLPATRLTGLVRRGDTLAPIAYASVQLRATNDRTKSSKTGAYALSAVQAGTQTAQVSAAGFTTLSQSVSLSAGQDTVVNFDLIPT